MLKISGLKKLKMKIIVISIQNGQKGRYLININMKSIERAFSKSREMSWLASAPNIKFQVTNYQLTNHIFSPKFLIWRDSCIFVQIKGMNKQFLMAVALVFFMVASLRGFAQTVVKEHKKMVITSPRAATVNMKDIKYDYFPKLQYIEMPKPGMSTEEDDSELNAAKARVHPIPGAPQPQNKQGGSLNAPYELRNFEGNSYDGGVPDDNSLAVSDSGKILSARNSSLNVYDSTGKLIKNVSLDAFSSSLGIHEGKYDPKVLYDEDADRFIAVFLSGQADSNSHAIIGFSQTNDPAGTWNLYKISGNPLNDTTWSDFPIIKITKNELFITLNALHNNKSWQLGFKQDYIWQIDKLSGYNGDSLKAVVHSGIVYNGVHVRYICPVQGGSALTGPESYFVSDKSFTNQSDSIFLIKLSGLLSDTTSTLSITLLHSKTNKYGVPPSAHQPSTPKLIRTLQTNDARILDAFIENNAIQFVGNSVTSKGKAGAMHGIISNVASAPSVSIDILGDTLEFGYPSIAYAGIHSGDDDALIVVDHSADTTNPGNSAIFYKAGVYSSSHRLYSGSSFVQISGINERWGDYSGAQRKYNQPGKAWAAAFYGRTIGSGINLVHGNAARISEFQSPLLPKPLGIKNETGFSGQFSVYPVPANNYRPVNIEFTSPDEDYYNFRIYDVDGRLVTNLLHEKVNEGKNRFTFSTSPLKKGIYILSVSSNQSIYSQKFVVE